MNMFSGFLNSIPVVGHVKGLLHYAVGDTQEGNHAMYSSTRSLVVAAAGAAGVAAGPVGAVILGALVGILWDGIIATDIIAVVVASDAYVTLLSVAGFFNAVAQKENYGHAHHNEAKSRDQGQDEDSKTSTPLPDGRPLTRPPSSKRRFAMLPSPRLLHRAESHQWVTGTRNTTASALPEWLTDFLDAFGGPESVLDRTILDKWLFTSLSDRKKQNLQGIVERLSVKNRQYGSGVDITVGLFYALGKKVRAGFAHFSALANIVDTYFRHEHRSLADNRSQKSIIGYLSERYRSIEQRCLRLQSDPATRLNPDFADPVRAVYHYYKHRILPTGDILSESDYYRLINRMMARMEVWNDYRAFLDPRSDSSKIVYETLLVLERELSDPLCGLVRLCIRSTEGGKLVLATCFVERKCLHGTSLLRSDDR